MPFERTEIHEAVEALLATILSTEEETGQIQPV